MHSSLRATSRVVAALVFVSLLKEPSSGAADLAGVAAAKCQRAVATGSQAFLARQLSDLGRCVGAAATCVETLPDDAACLAAAGVRCARTVARNARRADRLARLIAGRCAAVDPVTLSSADGLGFADLAPLCPALGTDAGDAAVLGACLAGSVRCRGEQLLAHAVPRAGELLRVAGVAAAARASLACLPDRGGSGRGVRDAAVGEAVTRCMRTSARAAARLVVRMLGNVAVCTRAARACRGRGDDGTSCRADVVAGCDAAFARIAAARAAFRRAVAATCGPSHVDPALLLAPTGADLDALVDECAAVQVEDPRGLADLTECLARHHECDAIALVRAATPRTDALLAGVGATVDRSYCAAPTPRATAATTPLPTEIATPTSTGPTRTARPGETATPTPHATPTRTRTPVPQPSATPFCGNGIVDDGEECDGADFDDNTCEDLCFESDPLGTLACTARCTIDFSGCRGTDCEAP